MVVGLVSLAHAISHAYGAILPLILPALREEFHLTYAQIGLMFTLSNLVWGPLQLGFGILGRYYSRKRILGIGHICQGLAIGGRPWRSPLGACLPGGSFLVLLMLHSIPIGNALISQSFTAERRGLGFALNTAGANLGTVAVPVLGGLLIVAFGWRSTLALFGLVGTLVGAMLMVVLNDPRAPGRGSVARPRWARNSGRS